MQQYTNYITCYLRNGLLTYSYVLVERTNQNLGNSFLYEEEKPDEGYMLALLNILFLYV